MNDLLDPLGQLLARLIRGEDNAFRPLLIGLAGVAILLAIAAALIATLASSVLN
jgi:hypothetical protein